MITRKLRTTFAAVLGLAGGCSGSDDATAPGGDTAGAIEVATATSGLEPDADGYTVALNGGEPRPVSDASPARFDELGSGTHTVALGGLAANCAPAGGTTRSVDVVAGETTRVDFTVVCATTVSAPTVAPLDATDVNAIAGTIGATVTANGADAAVGFEYGTDATLGSECTPSGGATGQQPVAVTCRLTGLALGTTYHYRAFAENSAGRTVGEIRTFTTTMGRIAFTRSVAGAIDIYLINADGSGPVIQVTSRGDAINAEFSPDGRRLAFASINNDGDVFTVNPDGTGLVNVTNDALGNRDPAWSPDGSMIAYASRRGTNYQILVRPADGSGTTIQLTSGTSHHLNPSWSPDASRIVIQRGSGFSFGLVVIPPTADGAQLASLGSGQRPTWSPDGSLITFTHATSFTTPSQIFAVAPDGTGRTPITTEAEGTGIADWSPDGSRIVLTRYLNGVAVLSTMNRDGTGLTDVAGAPTGIDDPTWGP